MKSIYKFFSYSVFILFTFISCTSAKQIPRFVSIFTGEIHDIKLESYTQQKNNNIALHFDKNIKDISCTAFFDDENEALTCTIQKENEKDFTVLFPEEMKIEIGQNYNIKGEVKDKWGNSLLFSLPFIGANNRPCLLKISEVRPLYSKKPNGEFIEMIVEKEGNLSGIKIVNVGSKKEPDYTFPPAFVKKGEIVVYHWRSFEEDVKDEIDASIISKGSGASMYARDFWGRHKSLPRRKNNAIVIEENDNIQDAILYFDPKTEDDDWSTEEIANAAKKAFDSGIWIPSAEIKDAVRYHITPSTSVGRRTIPQGKNSNAKQWVLYKSKQVTQGKRNR